MMVGRYPISSDKVIRRDEIDWSQGLLKIRISEAEQISSLKVDKSPSLQKIL